VSAPLPAVVPWIVAEAIALEILGQRPASVHVHRDPGDRILRQLAPAAGEPALPWQWPLAADPDADCTVWVGDGCTSTLVARTEVLASAARCRDLVVLCEPLAPGVGLGLSLLRAIDPDTRIVVTDEVTDGPDRTRERKPWEPSPRWALARARAWRFDADAELAREGYLGRLGRMDAGQILVAARRVLARFARAHEVLLLGVVELVRRGDPDGAAPLLAELERDTDVAPSILAAARRSWIAAAGPTPVRRVG